MTVMSHSVVSCAIRAMINRVFDAAKEGSESRLTHPTSQRAHAFCQRIESVYREQLLVVVDLYTEFRLNLV
jgi:hypothetical protein